MVSTGMGTAMERNRYELATGKFIATSTYKPAEALGEKNMDKVLDGVQTALDVAGMVQGIGEAADFGNGLISVVRGDYAGAAGPVFKQLENLPDLLKEKILKKLMDLFNSLKSGGLKKTLDGASAAMDDIFKDISKEIPELGEALTDIKDVICKPKARADVDDTLTQTIEEVVEDAVEYAAETAQTTRVGRWMFQDEYGKMVKTGKVQMSGDNKVHVANPANIDSFGKQAPKGSIYVEFDVPSDTISAGGADGWGIINAPGSLVDRLRKRKGLPSITEMPGASNIQIMGGR